MLRKNPYHLIGESMNNSDPMSWRNKSMKRLFRIDWMEKNWEINTTPHSIVKYLYCTAFKHDMEPYNYDEIEPCKRCGIEDDRNIMTLRYRWRNLFGDRFARKRRRVNQ
jgi:hypothetical protein